jgi:hypothetical protein
MQHASRRNTGSVADVFVIDGFTGNVLLKTMKGTFRFLSRALKDVFLDGWGSKMAGLVSLDPRCWRSRSRRSSHTARATPSPCATAFWACAAHHQTQTMTMT